ncbi:hypothetical protein [Lysinibacillus sp. FJAT-14745]|nr:hypothetical protein [Lysinibacillus sp. FJAT-14745]
MISNQEIMIDSESNTILPDFGSMIHYKTVINYRIFTSLGYFPVEHI